MIGQILSSKNVQFCIYCFAELLLVLRSCGKLDDMVNPE